MFSGIGGFSLGLERTGGFRTVAFCEIEPFCQRVLAKHWPDVPIHHDVRKLTGKDVGPVDVVCGGFPCQDISCAGQQAGMDGTRSGLWSEIARLISEIRPTYVIVENVSNLLSGPSERPGGWFGRVLGDLATIGFDAEWHCIPASYVGAWHRRDRVWLVAYPASDSTGSATKPILRQRHLSVESGRGFARWPGRPDLPKSRFRGDDDGLPRRLERNVALGNAVVPQIPEIIGRAILEAESHADARDGCGSEQSERVATPSSGASGSRT